MRALLIAFGATVAVWLVLVVALVTAGRRTAAKELAVLLPNLLRLFRGLSHDPRVPRGSKAWLVFGAMWIASPIDLIPEFIPIAGPLDDAIVAALVLRHVVRRAGPEVVREHWHGSEQTLAAILRIAGVRAV